MAWAPGASASLMPSNTCISTPTSFTGHLLASGQRQQTAFPPGVSELDGRAEIRGGRACEEARLWHLDERPAPPTVGKAVGEATHGDADEPAKDEGMVHQPAQAGLRQDDRERIAHRWGAGLR